MTREYRKRIFEILDQIDELTEPLMPLEKPPQAEAEAPGSEGKEQKEEGRKSAGRPDTADMELPEGWTGPNHDTKKRYSPEFKKMVVKMHKEGRTFESITNEFGVSKATITKWCSDARYANWEEIKDKEKELQAIREENAKIKEENAFLRQVLVMMFGKEVSKSA
ncbi:MAG: transposase [Clostridiales bacterium]|nr:transposase [Clostridiales bacterium]